MTRRIDPTDIDDLNEFLEEVVRLEPYEPRTISDWFSLCTEIVRADMNGEYFSHGDVSYKVRDVTRMPSYDGDKERALLRKLKRRLNRLMSVKSTRLEEEMASIAGAEGRTRLILILETDAGVMRYHIGDWDKHWESFSIGGVF